MSCGGYERKTSGENNQIFQYKDFVVHNLFLKYALYAYGCVDTSMKRKGNNRSTNIQCKHFQKEARQRDSGDKTRSDQIDPAALSGCRSHKVL